MSAVSNGKVFVARRAPFGWFDRPPSVNRLIGGPWLLSVLYPDFLSFFIELDVGKFYHCCPVKG